MDEVITDLKKGVILDFDDIVDRGDFRITIAEQYGKPRMTKSIEHICEKHPHLPWRIRHNGKWYRRKAKYVWLIENAGNSADEVNEENSDYF